MATVKSKAKPKPKAKAAAVRRPKSPSAKVAAATKSKSAPAVASKRAMSKPSKNVLVPRGAPRTDDAPWSVLRADGTALPGRDPKLAPELMLRMYRAMTLIRALDGRMLILQRQGRIGFWGPTRGQEGATIASCAAFEDRDWILPALREGGCALYRGFSLTELVAQTIGNALDRVKGRQMPCH